jgi:hypothetical protein
MRRLDYTRKARSVPLNARNAAEAVMFLAQVARERHRLEQEKHTLDRRIRRIELRLGEIARTEGRLVPVVRRNGEPGDRPASPPAAAAPQRPAVLPPGVTQVTLTY